MALPPQCWIAFDCRRLLSFQLDRVENYRTSSVFRATARALASFGCGSVSRLTPKGYEHSAGDLRVLLSECSPNTIKPTTLSNRRQLTEQFRMPHIPLRDWYKVQPRWDVSGSPSSNHSDGDPPSLNNVLLVTSYCYFRSRILRKISYAEKGMKVHMRIYADSCMAGAITFVSKESQCRYCKSKSEETPFRRRINGGAGSHCHRRRMARPH